jgi:hypothetical protein
MRGPVQNFFVPDQTNQTDPIQNRTESSSARLVSQPTHAVSQQIRSQPTSYLRTRPNKPNRTEKTGGDVRLSAEQHDHTATRYRGWPNGCIRWPFEHGITRTATSMKRRSENQNALSKERTKKKKKRLKNTRQEDLREAMAT